MRPFERESIAAAVAMSVHCTVNLRPGYSGVSIGRCRARPTASIQRPESKPTAALPRLLLGRSVPALRGEPARLHPAPGVEAYRRADAPVQARAEAQQLVVEI